MGNLPWGRPVRKWRHWDVTPHTGSKASDSSCCMPALRASKDRGWDHQSTGGCREGETNSQGQADAYKGKGALTSPCPPAHLTYTSEEVLLGQRDGQSCQTYTFSTSCPKSLSHCVLTR